MSDQSNSNPAQRGSVVSAVLLAVLGGVITFLATQNVDSIGKSYQAFIQNGQGPRNLGFLIIWLGALVLVAIKKWRGGIFAIALASLFIGSLIGDALLVFGPMTFLIVSLVCLFAILVDAAVHPKGQRSFLAKLRHHTPRRRVRVPRFQFVWSPQSDSSTVPPQQQAPSGPPPSANGGDAHARYGADARKPV